MKLDFPRKWLVIFAVISLMVVLSMMQSSQVDERLAGNYRAQADAQMGAEKAACAGFGALEGPDDFVSVSLSLADLSSLGWQGFGNWPGIEPQCL